MTKIAFLGLGAMGQRMVRHLIDAGHDVTVWNRTARPAPDGATAAETPAAAAQDADMVLTMLTDDDAAKAVWAEVFPGMVPGALAVEMSTVSPARVAAFAAEAPDGISVIDAPVAGSRPQAEAGELVFLAGGAEADIAHFKPLAETMGKALLHAGRTGKGAVLKLMINGMLAVQTAALSEILAFGAANGIPPEKAKDLMAPVPVMSPAANFVAGQIVAGTHDPMFTVDLMEKDLGYLTGGSEMPLFAETRARFGAAQAAGNGGQHITAVSLT